MIEDSERRRAVELLQQLGYKEYEAKCYVALATIPSGTAKEISDLSEVPRTRVYEAVRVLESKGLVEIQHSNPQQFRAVPISEAAETIRQEYEERTSALADAVDAIEPARTSPDRDVTHEVWALSGAPGIANRARELVEGADEEVVLVLGTGSALTDALLDRLRRASEADVDVVVGTITPSLAEEVESAVPDATVFVSDLPWLDSSPVDPADDTTISRLLLVDDSTILVSTVHGEAEDGSDGESAVFGRGFDNGIVTIARRLMGTGLVGNRVVDADE